MKRPDRIRISSAGSETVEVGQEFDVYEWNEIANAPRIDHPQHGLITIDLSEWEPVSFSPAPVAEGQVLDINIPFTRKDDALHFTFADTSCELTEEDEEGNEVTVGRVQAMIGGGMKFTFYNEETGDREQYIASHKDMWNAFAQAIGKPHRTVE